MTNKPRRDMPKLNAPHAHDDLVDAMGLTTGSFMTAIRKDPAILPTLLLDLPQRVRGELDLRVIDLMSDTMPAWDAAYLDELRSRAERHGCILINLKMNHGVNMAAPEYGQRRHALEVYKQAIDAAARLGCRWVRPALRGHRPDLAHVVEGFRELIDYAAPHGISLLIENNHWMQDDPAAVPTIIERVGPGLAAAPDTGNWTGAVTNLL